MGYRVQTMSRADKTYDLYTFVAGAALETGRPFPLECNCGGIVTIMPPFQDEHVVCPQCEVRIRILVLDGDPGYIIGADSDGLPRLLPVQGSASPHPSMLSPSERDSILAKAHTHIARRGK
jgi:hypothetical protein